MVPGLARALARDDNTTPLPPPCPSAIPRSSGAATGWIKRKIGWLGPVKHRPKYDQQASSAHRRGTAVSTIPAFEGLPELALSGGVLGVGQKLKTYVLNDSHASAWSSSPREVREPSNEQLEY